MEKILKSLKDKGCQIVETKNKVTVLCFQGSDIEFIRLKESELKTLLGENNVDFLQGSDAYELGVPYVLDIDVSTDR